VAKLTRTVDQVVFWTTLLAALTLSRPLAGGFRASGPTLEGHQASVLREYIRPASQAAGHGTAEHATYPAAQARNDGWQTYENPIMGFRFEYPRSWMITSSPSGSERDVTVVSCLPDTKGCNRVSFGLQIGGVDFGVMQDSAYTKATVGGLSSAKRVQTVNHQVSTEIYVEREAEWYWMEMWASESDKAQADRILDHILSTFIFITPRPPEPPAEYRLFRGAAGWKLTYQRTFNGRLVCSDGRTGKTTTNYLFTMGTGENLENVSGDVDTIYGAIKSTLQANDWQMCKPIGPDEFEQTSQTSEMFIKNGRLIGVFRYYSMAVGKSLDIWIQYDR